jgi:hypothetical protein
LGIGDWGFGPIPNPQSPIPNPHYNNIIVVFFISIFTIFSLNTKSFLLLYLYYTILFVEIK